MQKFLATAILLSFAYASSLQAEEKKLSIVFTTHASASNTFWQAIKKGFDDGCSKVQARCQMIFTQTEGSIAEQQANMQAAIAQKPDALITSIVDDKAFDEVIHSARAKGITVIAANADDADGTKGNERQAYIGHSGFSAGYRLAEAQSQNFPTSGPLKIVVGVSAPGQNWSEQRAAGVMKFLEEFKGRNPQRKITLDRIDSGTDLAIVSERVGAYLNAHPQTNAYFDTGYWHAGVARVLADRGVPPGKILLSGFDLVPEALAQMKAGYIQFQVDQQPYGQGFLSVMMAYLQKTAGLDPSSIDTGHAVISPAQVAGIMPLSKQGLR